MSKIRHLFLKITKYGIFYTILAISVVKMHFLHYFSYTNVLKISPKLRLGVLINYVLIKKKVCNEIQDLVLSNGLGVIIDTI